jgi:hypothetical protein
MRFTAFKVSMPAERYSSCPVEIGSVSVSKSKSTGRMPYFLRRQIEDAMRDRNFFVRGQRHAFFVDGQRDHAAP